ncbi:MAG: hypothetical protein MZV70_75950 [Desulfobacterales bacterium]|nr:hypothetical protein [Desulfobacterales bacterium]
MRAIREAKARESAVTAETAPHYFLLTEEAVRHAWRRCQDEPAAAVRKRTAWRCARC